MTTEFRTEEGYVLLAFGRRGRLPGAVRVPSWGCAARSLIARLQVCDSGVVVTVGVLFWFPSASASSAGSLSTSSRASDSWDSCWSASGLRG